MKKQSIPKGIYALWWIILWPIRMYIRYSPIGYYRWELVKRIIVPLLPKDQRFQTEIQDGLKINLIYSESIGVLTLLNFGFETSELEYVKTQLSDGDYCMDVGANVGIFSLVMAKAVGPKGRVLSVEPHPDNLTRLRENLLLNNLSNVVLFPVAAANREGDINLNLAEDLTYISTARVPLRTAINKSIIVKGLTLDKIWQKSGCPDVKFIKIDIEGGEVEAFRGAKLLLESCMPLLLVEANTTKDLADLRALLGEYGYSYFKPEGFAQNNYIFSQ